MEGIMRRSVAIIILLILFSILFFNFLIVVIIIVVVPILTFHVANKFFPTDIRLNYENYWYPNGGTPKESEQDKLVAELMIRF